MAIQLQGNSGVVADVDGTTFRAQKVTQRPMEYGSAGHYKVSIETGAIAAGAAADAEILQLRNPSSALLAVITLLQVDYLYATTAFTAGLGRLRSTVARGWTTDGSGGTPAVLTGDNNQMRTTMGAAASTLRVSSTAALGAGTKTLDAQDVGQWRGAIAATANANLLDLKPVYLFNPALADGEHPLVLAVNEGLVVRATVPATGVWVCGLTVRWAEVTAF